VSVLFEGGILRGRLAGALERKWVATTVAEFDVGEREPNAPLVAEVEDVGDLPAWLQVEFDSDWDSRAPAYTATVPRATVRDMAAREDKVTVQVDAEMVERARAELGLGGGSDAAVVERALNAYLLGRLLDVTQAQAGLGEGEASRLAYEELRASRRERGAA